MKDPNEFIKDFVCDFRSIVANEMDPLPKFRTCRVNALLEKLDEYCLENFGKTSMEVSRDIFWERVGHSKK